VIMKVGRLNTPVGTYSEGARLFRASRTTALRRVRGDRRGAALRDTAGRPGKRVMRP